MHDTVNKKLPGKLIAILFVLPIFIACEGTKRPKRDFSNIKETKPLIPPVVQPAVTEKLSLVGKWQSGCVKDKDGLIESFNRTDEYTETEFKVTMDAGITETNCDLQSPIRVELAGTYSIGEAFDEGYQFNQVITKFMWTLSEAANVNYFNNNNICGYDDWVAGIGKDVISSDTCLKSTQIFDIVKIKNDALVFGDTNATQNANSNETRPTTWGPEDTYKKIP